MSKDRNRRAPSRPATRAEEPGSGDRPLVWPGDPEGLTADAVDFEALAHVLANTCRRGGRLRRFHSLAAHGVLMSEEIEALGEPGTGDGRAVALYALLADASVAWLGPEAASSRRGAERLKRLNGIVDRAVRESAGLDAEPSPEQAELLRFVARMAEAAEDRDLPGARDGAASAVAFPPLKRRIRTVDPGRAARLWLDRFRALKGQEGAGRGPIASAPEESSRQDTTPAPPEEPHVTHDTDGAGTDWVMSCVLDA